jgi:capsular polysaccharide transport system permease protein
MARRGYHLSEERKTFSDSGASGDLQGTVGGTRGGDGADARRSERGGDNHLARRERANPSRVPGERRIEQRLTVLPIRPPSKDRRPNAERAERLLLPPPVTVKARSHAQLISFVLAVVLPVIVATIYYGWIAANQYVAEFRFAVNDTTPSASSVGSSLMAMLSGSGGSAPLENYIVADYLTSRQAAEELQRRINVKALYSKPEADWWTRFNSSEPMEKFVTYWQKMVTANYDMVTGIAVAQVRAFTPEDALLIANSLVKLSEELVNKIANRSNIDAVHFAEQEVERAQQRLKTVRGELTAYRNKVGVIDPATSVVASNSTVQQTLQANLANLETQVTSLLNRHLLPTSPAVQTLQNQIKATKEQLAAIESTVGSGKDRAGGAALSSVIAEYEQLDLERQFAQTMVTSAMQALEQARAMAAMQHLYITPYVRPSLPESSIYPRRVFSVMMVGLLAFACWVVGLLIVRSIRERFG